MHTIEQLQDMLAEHKEWQAKINFYRSEIEQMKQTLSSTLNAESNQYNMPHVEHFQNQFILQKDVLDNMRHDFKQHENKIESHSSKPVLNLAGMHLNEREKLVSYEKIFKDLREEFQSFIHKDAFS
ncbi:MAG: hypothetical protein JSS90_09185 [Bacteroidetes bacterium]|jgi:aspartate/tyrosine/aromatic aminotransferase|nr:hypothetical protein [Bacteroidota bacterium]